MAKTLIVVDDKTRFPTLDIELLNFSEYLAEFPKRGEGQTRVINLCDTNLYLSQGYYCSLLAEARQHKVLPDVKTINKFKDSAEHKREAQVFLPQALMKSSQTLSDETVYLYFGQSQHDSLHKLARHLFALFPVPIMKVTLTNHAAQWSANVESVDFSQLDDEQQQRFLDSLKRFTGKVWRSTSQKKYRWDMAILVNPEEATPPSNAQAIAKFVKAAKQVGINAEAVTHEQINLLNRFDALFIRETTSIKHHTYALASAAEQQGLVVMDDPTSILRCCNKVFLHDAFSYNNVPTLRTQFVSRKDESTLIQLEQEFGYPLVLKLPESSFSLGVFKVANRSELNEKLDALLKQSALVLVQEYFSTDFDWRIGVLNGRAFYACKYMMARNH